MSEEDPQAQTVDQPAVTPDPGAGAHREANLDALLDVPVNVTVEIGRVSLPIKELLNLLPIRQGRTKRCPKPETQQIPNS